jgi:hypothetical protein
VPTSEPEAPAIAALRPGAAARTVLLRHTLPDGSHHFDWMIEAPVARERRLVTFRADSAAILPHPPHSPTPERKSPPAALFLTSIGDHRAAYLDYEGAIAGGRGVVERVGRGVVTILSRRPDGLDMTIEWESDAEHRWAQPARLRKTAVSEQWTLEFAGIRAHPARQ